MKRLLAGPRVSSLARTPLILDDGNRDCVAAISRIVGGETRLALPLVIAGAADTGKTRQLIELEDRFRARGKSVFGGTVARWIQYIKTARAGRTEQELCATVASASFVFIDEFHRVRTAPSTRDFLLARVEERVRAGLPTAVAVRYAPHEDYRANSRYVSVLKGGFLVMLAKPGRDARRRFVMKYTRGALEAAAMERICDSTSGGFGALARACDRLQEAGVHAPVPVMADHVAAAVAREFGVDLFDLTGRRRTAGLVQARKVLVHTAILLGIGHLQLRPLLAGRGDLALRRVAALAAGDPAVAAAAVRIAARLRAGQFAPPARESEAKRGH